MRMDAGTVEGQGPVMASNTPVTWIPGQ